MLRIAALFPRFCRPAAVSYTCLSLCKAMANAGSVVAMHVPVSDRAVTDPFVRKTVPFWLRQLYGWRCFRPLTMCAFERRFLHSLRHGDIAYLWPGTRRSLARRIRKRDGVRIVIENINCHQGTAKRILDDAYARAGWPAAHGITEVRISHEREMLGYADAVFAANPSSAASLAENGVPKQNILLASYGWEPDRFRGKTVALPHLKRPVFLSVGFVCLRKGAPLAMEAWQRAGIDGTLLFVGRMFEDVREHCADSLDLNSIMHLEYQEDIGAIYRSAHVFFFLTLEEGGPMVTFEAMGCGLPILTTPMGAGEVCRDGIEGFVVDPYDEDMIVDRLRQLASDTDLRHSMGEAARVRAMEYTWDKVGARRLRLLQERFGVESCVEPYDV